MSENYAVFIHRLYFNGQIKKGGLDQIIEYLLINNREIFLIEYPLDYSQHQYIYISKVSKNSRTTILKIGPLFKVNILNWPIEVIIGLLFSLLKLNKDYVVITSDPLTTLPAAFLRRIKFFKYLYYHAVDFSLDRFHNKLLDTIYSLLFKYGLKSADLVGIVTKRALERFTSLRSGPFFYVPNSPVFEDFNKYRLPVTHRDKNALVITCAEVSDKFRVYAILKMTLALKSNFPDLSLHILGNFDLETSYCKNLQTFVQENSMDTYVHFYGNVSKEENCKIIGGCGIGLAFYDDDSFKHIKFGDSLKIREYAALGLPTVADKATSTAIDMMDQQAGYCVTDFDSAKSCISDILNDSELYTTLSTNALNWAQSMDKAKILSNLFVELSKPHE